MTQRPPTIDMSPDGSFRVPPRPGQVPLSVKLGLGAAAIAVLGLSLTVAALAVYIVSLILPVVVIAGAVAWGAMKYRRWQLGRGTAPYAVQPRGFRQ
ncbi:MAG: hypothetical protein ACRYGM_14185 [Janthinobacterium lividum]